LLLFFTIIFTIYHIYLSYHRTKHFITILKSKKLEVRNSPLDRFAFYSARALFCLKYGCEQAQPVGLVVGITFSIDEILKWADHEPVFAPFLGSMLKNILPENATKSKKRLILNTLEIIEANNMEILENESLLERFKSVNLKNIFTKDEYSDINNILKENKEVLENKDSELNRGYLENKD